MEIIVGWVTTNGKISSMDLAFTAGSNMVSSEKEKVLKCSECEMG